MKTILVVLATALFGAAVGTGFGATEYFADANGGSDAYDGLAEVWDGTHGPKRTVQAAVAVAEVGSTKANRNTVTLLPGDYASGLTAVTQDNVTTSNRVVISAPILLRSKEGRRSRDTTRVIGAWDTSGASDTQGYMGPRAVRCVWVHADAVNGTRIEGLTFLRGAAAWGGDGADHSQTTGGGGVLFDDYGNRDGLVVDCAFIECIGTRGGGLFNGTAVRCLFTRCRASKFGCAARQCNAYNCVFADNLRCRERYEGGTWTFSYPYNVVNCTFVGNDSGGVNARTASSAQPLWNCIFFRNANGEITSEFAPTNCVSDVKGAGRAAAITNELFSPATGDYRLTEGAAATTAGSTEWLEKIPEEFRNTDYLGNPRTTGGKVFAGAVQATAKPAGGAYELTPQYPIDRVGLVSCNGHACVRPLYEQGETWPRLVQFAWTPGDLSGSTNLIRFCNGRWESVHSLYPLTNNTAWALAPQSGTKAIYYQFGPTLYVDPVAGNDLTGDGSRAKPWRTLQKAVDRDSRAVIQALPGDYAEGATYYLGCSNRVHVTTKEPLRIIATEGPEKTFITGAPDTTTPLDAKGWGIGSNAVRCVSVGSAACCAFQGFTLRGGRGSQNPTNDDCDAARGAGFLNGINSVNHKTGFLLDSVVRDCRGSRGPAAYGGISERTVFTDCSAHGLGVFRYAELRGCIVTNNSGAGGILADISTAYNTTFYANSGTTISHGYAYNCAASGSTCDVHLPTSAKDVHSGCVFATTSSSYVVPEDCAQEDPHFNDAPGGDLRLISGSAGTWLGKGANLNAATDFTGRPFSINAEGRTRAGAFDELVPGVRVEKGNGSDAEVFYVPEEGLTVTGKSYNGRSCLTLAVNGVTQEVGTVSHTVSQAAAKAVVPYVVTCVYPTQFFVDAAAGSDANEGTSEAKAWKTLAHASTNACWTGDCVTVLPGTYDEGEVFVPYAYTRIDSTTVGTRVQVAPGVTFASRDGAESTIILGARGTGTVETVNIDADGCGPGAVKCAFICNGAVLRGFTLRGGRGDTGWISLYDNKDRQYSANMGAGAFGGYVSGAGCFETYATRRVENCIIDDCFSPRGGAARYVGLFNCTITGCGGNNMGAAVRDSVLNGCVIAKTRRMGSDQYYNCAFDSCTVLADNESFTINHDKTAFPNGIPVVNCAICRPSWLNGLVYSNCAFAAGTTLQRAAQSGFINENALTGISDFGLDAQGHPAKTSPLVDAGNRAILPPWPDCSADAADTPRVLNGEVDIGAFEYDWRTDFSKALAKRRLAVTEVTPEATLIDGSRLAWRDGSIALDWARGGTDLPYSFTLSVDEGASLVVTLNGETLGTYGAGTQTVSFRSTEDVNALTFTATGAANISAFTHAQGSILLLR